MLTTGTMVMRSTRVSLSKRLILRPAAAAAFLALSSPVASFSPQRYSSSFVRAAAFGNHESCHRVSLFQVRGGSQQLSSTAVTAVDQEELCFTSMTPTARLDALRKRMKDLDLDVYLVPSDDPHLSGKFLQTVLLPVISKPASFCTVQVIK
jgi:hypothetical protein